jgi:hypothetical protein
MNNKVLGRNFKDTGIKVVQGLILYMRSFHRKFSLVSTMGTFGAHSIVHMMIGGG